MKEFKINSHSITERDNIAIAHYLREINHIDRITPEEEVRLTALIKRGGKAGVRAKEQRFLRIYEVIVNPLVRFSMYHFFYICPFMHTKNGYFCPFFQYSLQMYTLRTEAIFMTPERILCAIGGQRKRF